VVRLQEWRENPENLWENRAKICDAKKKANAKSASRPSAVTSPRPSSRGARRTPRREPSTRERPTRDSEKLSFVHADGRDDHRNRLSRE